MSTNISQKEKNYTNELKTILKHRLIKNTFVYTVTNTFRKGIPFLLLPILTRYLTPKDYGIIATFEVLVGIMIIFVSMRLQGAVGVNCFKLAEEKIPIYAGNTILIMLINFILTLCIIYVFGDYIVDYIKLPHPWLLIVVIVAFSQSIIIILLTIWQAKNRVLSYGVLQICTGSLNVLLSLYLIVYLGQKWEGRILGITLASLIMGLIAFSVLVRKKEAKFKVEIDFIKDAVLFGIPLIPAALGWWVATSIDRIFLNSMINVETTGIYAVGYQFGMIIGLLVISFNQAWWPFLYEKLQSNSFRAKIMLVRITYLYNVIVITLAILISIIAPFVMSFFVGTKFHRAHEYVLWISLAYAFNGMRYMILNYIYYAKKTYVSAWIPFFCGFLNIVLNLILIKKNGGLGAAQATAITFFIGYVLTWVVSARVFKMPWIYGIRINIKEA